MIDPFIGKTIGKYEIVAYVGRGATADVYKAYQPALDRYVAIKVLHPFLSEDPDFLIRFQTEAKSAARLRHPNIVQVYDFDILQGMYYLVMEFIEGTTLKNRLQEMNSQQQPLSLDESIRITRAVAGGLAYAHTNGLIHRDIKPANIMLSKENQIILTDFGTAKIIGSKHTASGVTVGTAAYASPEQVMAQGTDARSDLYSLGVVFFEMVTGQAPFSADTGVAVFLKHITDPIPNPCRLNPALPPDVESFVYRAMAKKPEERYASAEEMTRDLDLLHSSIPFSTPKPSALGIAPLDLPQFAADLAAPQPVAAPPDFQLVPYTLSPGNVAKQPSDLPSVCDMDWDRAATHFSKGYIAEWLRDGVKRLRAGHQHGLADDLEAIVNRADALVAQIAPNDEMSRHAALEEFLNGLGAPRPLLHVAPDCLQFPPAGVETSGRAIPMVITNQGRGYLFGEVIAQVSWLYVKNPRFGCGPGKSFTVIVEPRLQNVPAGLYEQDDALVIRSISGQRHVLGQIEVIAAILDLDTNVLDFGGVGQGDEATISFGIRNRGAGMLVGKLESLAPWLQISPRQFQIAPGQEITVTADADSLALRAGATLRASAIIIESNGGHDTLDAKIEIYSPRLTLNPPRVELGVLDIASLQFKQALDLNITNDGFGVLLGTLKPEEAWLSVEPASFRCYRGQTQAITLMIANLKTGVYRQVVRIESNAEDTILPVTARVIFSLEPKMVFIPAGIFLRGVKSPEQDEGGVLDEFFRSLRPEARKRELALSVGERPQTEIYMSDYWVGKYPVTNAEYAVFLKATNRRAPEHWVDDNLPTGLENHPVVNVTWHQARAYCFWLSEVTGKSYHLPTEAQWEKAARGVDGRIFPWGNRWDRNRCNTLERDLQFTTPAGSFSPDGDSPYACADMAGNVWEWTLDWYAKDYYARSTSAEDPRGPANGAVKVLRGGSFRASASQARTTHRLYANPNNPSPEVGFRVAMKDERMGLLRRFL